MENNNYINEEQGVPFDYCSKLNKNRSLFSMAVISTIFIPLAVFMAYTIYKLMTNPASVGDSTSENILLFIVFALMLAFIFIFEKRFVFEPFIKKVFSKKILMSKEGIYSQVNNCFMQWDEIKEISVGLKGARNSIISQVFIQRDNYKFNTWSLKNVIFDKDLITVECTYEVLDTIDRFYDDEIVNSECYQPKAEKKYVIGLMIFSIALLIFLVGIFIWLLFVLIGL